MIQSNKGISPVIGVILMVAVTVSLVALVTIVAFDISTGFGDRPPTTLTTTQMML